MSSNGKTKTIIGTKQFRAPEIVSKDGYSYEVDFWSLGVLVFYLLTDAYPFEKFKNAINDPMPDMNEVRVLKDSKHEISEIASSFVRNLLIKNPKRRLGSNTNEQNIKKDEFFRRINFDLLETGQLEPPIKPRSGVII